MFRSNICALIARTAARPALRTTSRSLFSASQTHTNNAAINSNKHFSHMLYKSDTNKMRLFNASMSHLPLHKKLHYLAATNVATTAATPVDATNTAVNTAAALSTPLTDTTLQAADQIATTVTQLTPYTMEYFKACTFFHVCT